MTTVAERLTLAYLAGVIDSDGSIGVRRSTYGMPVTHEATQPVYSERITVKQVERHAVDLLKATFGGYFGISDPSAKRGKPLFMWEVTDLQAFKCASALRPYLRIKAAQADNVIALREAKTRGMRMRVAVGRGHVGGAVRPADITAEQEALFLRAKELNKVGI